VAVTAFRIGWRKCSKRLFLSVGFMIRKTNLWSAGVWVPL